MTGIASPFGIAAISMIIIGIVLAAVGLVILIASQGNPKQWYIWLLLIGGIILVIAGGIMLAIALSRKPDVARINYHATTQSEVVNIL